MNLEDLEIYQLARELGRDVWLIYSGMDWRERKIIGDQLITAIDSVGANIAEGFGRYHFIDKNKFNYNARGSLLEVEHWLEILQERGKIEKKQLFGLKEKIDKLHRKLNNYINSTKKQKLSN